MPEAMITKHFSVMRTKRKARGGHSTPLNFQALKRTTIINNEKKYPVKDFFPLEKLLSSGPWENFLNGFHFYIFLNEMKAKIMTVG